MTSYKIKVDPDTLLDIKEISDWYNRRFLTWVPDSKKELYAQINLLRNSPYNYSIRYRKVHYLLMKKFPFLAHNRINEESDTIDIFAIIHTIRNPRIWEERSGDI